MGRLLSILKGIWIGFVNSIVSQHPEAILNAAKSEFDTKMMHYNQALAQMAGLASQLKHQIDAGKIRIKELERRVLANFNAGNSALAATLARELQQVKDDLAKNEEQYKGAETNYTLNMRQRDVVKKEFDNKIKSLESKISRAKIETAKAAAASAISNVSFKTGDLGDVTAGLDDVLDKQIAKASGEARVATDTIDVNMIVEKETETAALEQNALAEFLATQGIKVPESNVSSTVQKDMGPSIEVKS